MNKKTLFIILSILIVSISIGGTASAVSNPDVWAQKIQEGFGKIGAAVVVIGWVIAGILWLTSAGNPSKIAIAKAAIFACVVGTLLIIISTTAVAFITSTFGL